MTPSSRIAGTARVRRTLAWLLVAVAALLVTALLAVLVASSRAEHTMARALQAAPRVTYEPEVMYDGFPVFAGGRFDGLAITARGVRIDGCANRGACTADLGARLEQVRIDDVWSVGPATPIGFAALSAETRIDSVNLGRLLNIVDLYINTPAPEGKVGAGGPGDGLLERTEGIMLSGTVPLPGSPARDDGYPPSASKYGHPKVKVSVSVRVDVVDARLRITATDFYTGPEEHFADPVPAEFRSHVLKLFSATLPTLPLAWDTAPTRALSRGSDLILAGDAPGGTVEPIAF